MAARRITNYILCFNRNGSSSKTQTLHLHQHKMLYQPKTSLSFSAMSRRFQHRSFLRPFIVGVGGSLLGTYVITQYLPSHSTVKAEDKKEHILTRREQRYHDFASCELNGHIVMTPYDFIESLIENQPKLTRKGKIRLTPKDIKKIKQRTPTIEHGSTTFLRDIHQHGIITYSEYLFLVTILTKSNAGLRTALKMMDANGDKQITFEEFRKIEQMINESASCDTCVHHGDKDHPDEMPVTTLYLHLFGKDGKRVVTFEEFFTFMDNMQTEVLELEFHEYSKSLRFISEIDFAKILLRNTTLTEQEYGEYIDRLVTTITGNSRGVSMEQFKAFERFLSNIDDFIIAVNMTNVCGQDLDKEFFKRAVQVVTGEEVDSYIIDVVFSLFDRDGDGKLSPKEFICIMKDRLKRGFGKFPNLKGVRGFKHCLKKEMIKSAE